MPDYLFITPRGSGLPYFVELEPVDVMRPVAFIQGWHVDSKGRRQDRIDPPVERKSCRKIQKAMLHDKRGLVLV